jgi:hypothetical protein
MEIARLGEEFSEMLLVVRKFQVQDFATELATYPFADVDR